MCWPLTHTPAQDIDNLFFRYITVDWPFTRLVDLATNARLVVKPPLSALYKEGEPASKLVGNERCGPANTDGGRVNLRGRVSSVKRARIASKEEGPVPDSETNDGASVRMGVNNEKGLEDEEGTVGAYVIMRGSVDLYVLERWARACYSCVSKSSVHLQQFYRSLHDVGC